MKPQVKGVLCEDQVFCHQVVAAGKLRLLLTQSGYQTCFLFQIWNEKCLCVKSSRGPLLKTQNGW